MLQNYDIKLIRSFRSRKHYIGRYLNKDVNIVSGKDLEVSIGVWAGLSHLNITPLLKTFAHNDLYCAIYAVCRYRKMSDDIKLYGKYPDYVCIKVFEQLIDTVKYLHGMNILLNNLNSKTISVDRGTGFIIIEDLLDISIGNYSLSYGLNSFNSHTAEVSKIAVVLYEMTTGKILQSALNSKMCKNLKSSVQLKNIIQTLLREPQNYRRLSSDSDSLTSTSNPAKAKEKITKKQNIHVNFSLLEFSHYNSSNRFKIEAAKEYLYDFYPNFSANYRNFESQLKFSDDKDQFMAINKNMHIYDGSVYAHTLLEVLYYESMLY